MTINLATQVITGNTKTSIINDYDKKELAIAYLILRADKLIHYKKLYYEKLDAIYQSYKEDTITKTDINFLLFLSDSPKYPEASYINLRKIYFYDYCINKYLKYNDSHQYIINIHNYLMEHLRLTNDQIDGLIQFFKNSKQKFKYSRILF